MKLHERKGMWANGANYESYIGRWSRLAAFQFLPLLGVPSGARWLDVGCGTGVLSQAILDTASPHAVLGIDSSEGYIEFARKRVQDPRVAFRLGDAQALLVESSTYDAVVSGLGLNFFPKPSQALGEMVRAVRKGGTVAAYVWDYAGQMQLMRYFWDAAVALDGTVLALDEGQRCPLCQPEPLRQLFQTADLGEVGVILIDVASTFRNFDDYWSPFLGGQGPAPGYAMSLSEERRVALRERIRLTLPIAPDGSIHLIARAWAVHGVRKN
jgi:SAM-dependent methyltransferase